MKSFALAIAVLNLIGAQLCVVYSTTTAGTLMSLFPLSFAVLLCFVARSTP